MTRFLQIATVSAMFLVVAGLSEASSHNKSGGTNNHGSQNGSLKNNNNHHDHPNKTYSHDHYWSYRYWNWRYGCEFCYSPYDSCYFYFYAPANCYYPVSCIDQFPPTPGVPPSNVAPTAPAPMPTVPPMPPAVVNVNQNTNVTR